MKEIKITGPAQGIKISPATSPGCGCSPVVPGPAGDRASAAESLAGQDFVTGTYAFNSRTFPQVNAAWKRADHRGQVRSRLGAFRMSYAVMPGLYAKGTPDGNSPVLVSCNYKLSFDIIRRELADINAWILVLDTKGINVWCAAGKGTFGTAEVIHRIQSTGLIGLVDHKKIILPQLGAPGVNAAEVQRRTGMRVYFGPVRAGDIPAYLENNMQADAGMRRITFPIKDRFILTPMEIVPAARPLLIFTVAILLLAGLQPRGILFHDMLIRGMPLVFLGTASVLAGAFLTPVLLPFIPFRSFALKGWLMGMAVTAALVYTAQMHGGSIPLLLAMLIFFPAAASYLALQFTGATTYTGISGVKKELHYALPVYKGAAILSAMLMLGDKIMQWGIL